MCQNFCEIGEFRSRQLILLLVSCSCQGFLSLRKKRVELMKSSGEKVGAHLYMSMSVGRELSSRHLLDATLSWMPFVMYSVCSSLCSIALSVPISILQAPWYQGAHSLILYISKEVQCLVHWWLSWMLIKLSCSNVNRIIRSVSGNADNRSRWQMFNKGMEWYGEGGLAVLFHLCLIYIKPLRIGE